MNKRRPEQTRPGPSPFDVIASTAVQYEYVDLSEQTSPWFVRSVQERSRSCLPEVGSVGSALAHIVGA